MILLLNWHHHQVLARKWIFRIKSFLEKPAEGVNSSAKVPQKPNVFPIVSDEEDEDDAQLPTVVAQD